MSDRRVVLVLWAVLISGTRTAGANEPSAICLTNVKVGATKPGAAEVQLASAAHVILKIAGSVIVGVGG